MPNVDLSFASDPNTLALALIYGMIPAVAWLLFWLRENRERPRKPGALAYAFLGGALMVIVALPVEKFLATLSSNINILTILWASAEEFLKFCVFAYIIYKSASYVQAPADYPVYIMVIALGFAGFENALYFLSPLQSGDTVVLMLSTSMRFLGTTLMHATFASLSAIGLGLAYYKPKKTKIVWCALGLALGMALHSIFNILIVTDNGQNFFQVFGVLWLATVVIMILFEKLRSIGTAEFARTKAQETLAHIKSMLDDLLAKAGVTSADEVVLVEALKHGGTIVEEADQKVLAEFLAALRQAYAAYLGGQGTERAGARAAVLKLIPDTITAKAASGIMAVLLREA